MGRCDSAPETSELFANGQPQTLARWPNDGFVKTGEILGTNTIKIWNSIDGCKDGRFRFVGRIAPAPGPMNRTFGSTATGSGTGTRNTRRSFPWEAGDKSFTLAEPFSVYGYRKDQRYFAVNVLRELDQPGEWYLNRTAARLYWLPPAGLNPANSEGRSQPSRYSVHPAEHPERHSPRTDASGGTR